MCGETSHKMVGKRRGDANGGRGVRCQWREGRGGLGAGRVNIVQCYMGAQMGERRKGCQGETKRFVEKRFARGKREGDRGGSFE